MAAERWAAAQFSHAQGPPAANHPTRKVGPACALLVVVKCKQHALPLLLIERRKKLFAAFTIRYGGVCAPATVNNKALTVATRMLVLI